jgi:hypothetical protein
MKRLVFAFALVLVACTESSGVKVIVGAKLIAAPDRAPIEYSVVVIENGKFREVGPQSSTPVPKGAEITRGNGMTLEPAAGGDSIEPGHAANLILKGATERQMHDGEWVN